MSNIDPVRREIAVADFLFARRNLFQSMAEAMRATAQCARLIEELSVEAALFAKDDPFCEDGSPCETAMRDFAACDAAMERLADIRSTLAK
ncbi:hypothetical protein [Mesorhizobium sp. J428]|uniref:hypothetical protein n=1 Tax=Mesorhizobium sp. J428 TaxID=2898440 RepID=UPI002151E3A6|nr:hypothetical protein [Mesorhizobium sp. J428]MCR5859738.1 hypothetical protein [Mesorhizobium sp. J428]